MNASDRKKDLSLTVSIEGKSLIAKTNSRAVNALDSLFGSGLEWLDHHVKRLNLRKNADNELLSEILRNENKEIIGSDDIKKSVETIEGRAEFRKIRQQINLEQITMMALENGVEEIASEENVSEEWLSRFSDFAQNVSEDSVQAVWAKLLAGEIKNPGSYSVSTMRIIAESNPKIAQLFQEISKNRLDGINCIIKPKELRGLELLQYMQLEECGLLVNVNGFLNFPMSPTDGRISYIYGNYLLNCEQSSNVEIQIIKISEAGQQICRLMDPPDQLSVASAIASQLVGTATNISIIELDPQTRLPTGKPPIKF